MAVFAQDAFTGTTDDTLATYSASWSKHANFAANLLISAGDRVKGAAQNVTAVYVHSATPGNADYTVDIDVYGTALAPLGENAVVGRASASATTFYLARWVANGSFVDIYKVSAGAFTQLVSGVGVTAPGAAASKVLRLAMVGSTIKVFWDGVERGSASDSGLAGPGLAGIWLATEGENPGDAAGWHTDNFLATDTTGGATYTGTAAVTLSALTASGTGTFAAPTYTGSAAVNLPALTAAGTGAHTAPTYTGAAAVSLPALTATGTGTATEPTATGAAAVALPALTAAGVGTFTAPAYTGSATITLPALVGDGDGIFASAVFAGSAAVGLPTLTASGSGTFAVPTYTGTGAATLPALSVAGVGTHTGPLFTATGAGTLAALTAAGVGTFSEEGFDPIPNPVAAWSGGRAATWGSDKRGRWGDG